ncbi:MAG: ribosomal RNA small subunit methyltransferase A [Planctomycetes bacterium]|nr:ribosomal RNA small subunit methyltransferase A [Planctomycetota bacterium]
MSRPSFAEYRAIMEAHGFRPSRRFGQNFLLDPSLHRAIADAAELERSDLVLEVGAGLGFLTRELVTRAGRVVAVEIDDRLLAILRDDVVRWEDAQRVEFVHADALEGDGLSGELVAAVTAAAVDLGPIKLVANLPYAVSGRFLAAALASTELTLRLAVIVVQRELADRLAAAPGSRDYGGLSVLSQACGPVELVRPIGREVFRPRPNVDSALVRIDVRRPLPSGFAEFVRAMFASRRKTLRHAFGRSGVRLPAAVAEEFGRRRAEQCTAEEFLDLFALASQHGENPG